MESSVVIKPVHLIFFQRRAYSNYLSMLRWFICFSECEKMHKLNDTLIICVMISSMVFESVQSVVLEFFAPRCCRSHDYNTTRSDKATDSFFISRKFSKFVSENSRYCLETISRNIRFRFNRVRPACQQTCVSLYVSRQTSSCAPILNRDGYR